MGNQLRVAVVGGNEFQRADLVRQVRAGNDCLVLFNGPADRSAMALVREAQPDLVLVWLDSPVIEAMGLVRNVMEVCREAKVWLVGNAPTETYTPLARRWGAAGYLHWQSLEIQLTNGNP